MTSDRKIFKGDDLAVWPDGEYAELRDVWNGEYNWKSDDYVKVRIDDTEELQKLGIEID